jgi:hypothetical protein
MLKVRMRTVLIGLFVTVCALLAGAALACSGNYCPDFDSSDCVYTGQTVTDTCCVDLTGSGVKRCATCSRQVFLCYVSNGTQYTQGPSFNCTTPGATCQ